MPKASYTSKRKSYVPRKRTSGATTRKPYGGSRYGNDAFVKIERIENLATPGGNVGEVFSTMRVCDGAANTSGNTYLGNQAEF